MQTEEQMKDLKAKLAQITKALNTSFPDLVLGKDVQPNTPKVEELAIKPELPVVKPELPVVVTPKENPKPKQQVSSSLSEAAEAFLNGANEYRGWLLRSTMETTITLTQPHVDLLNSLLSCVRELKDLDKMYPRKESLDELTLFSE